MSQDADLAPPNAAEIARVELMLARLERVAEVAMAVVEAVNDAVAAAPEGSVSLPDAARAFAQASRAVRLTLSMQARIGADLIALRKGEPPGGAKRRPAPAGEAAPASAGAGQCPVRDPIQAAVWGAIEQGAADEDEALHRFDRLYERLFESREYDRFDLSDFEGAVRAICADLGVKPDWSGWDVAAGGFARGPAHAGAFQRSRWSWSPQTAEARRKRLLAGGRRSRSVTTLARTGAFQLE